MKKIGLIQKIIILLISIIAIASIIYEAFLRIVPPGLGIRSWYQTIEYVIIILWIIIIPITTVIVCIALSKKLKKTIEKIIISLLSIFLCSISIWLLLMLGFYNLFHIEEEFDNGNGTITVRQNDFLGESYYYLWKNEGFIYRSFIRRSFDLKDIDPNMTIEEYFEINYPYSPNNALMEETITNDALLENDSLNIVENQTEFESEIDGLVSVYEFISSDKDGYNFSLSSDTHGNPKAYIYSDDSVIRFLIYDRKSKNQKCNLYVLYEAKKNSEGTYITDDAYILGMFAYDTDFGEVIDSGKTNWSDIGTEKYRNATGEN